MELDDILKKGLWSSLLDDANLQKEFNAPDEQKLKSGIRRIALVNDGELIRYWREYCLNSKLDANDKRLHMFHINLWGPTSLGWSLEECHQRFLQNPSALDDVVQILEFRSKKASITHGQWKTGMPLQIHAEYSRWEILAALGHWTTETRTRSTEGVLHLADQKVDAFFVDLHKTETHFSPTTMYDDYVISEQLFHWQSQSTTSDTSPTGQRYINHAKLGYTPLLFVRDRKKLESGLTSPFIFLGPCTHASHEGSRPISIVWKLETPLPSRLLRLKSKSVI
jgi:hypothetical protein